MHRVPSSSSSSSSASAAASAASSFSPSAVPGCFCALPASPGAFQTLAVPDAAAAPGGTLQRWQAGLLTPVHSPAPPHFGGAVGLGHAER